MSLQSTPRGGEKSQPAPQHSQSAEATLARINAVLGAVGGNVGGFGDDFFPRFVERLAQSLAIRIAFVAECMPENRVRMKAIWNKQQLDVPFDYDLADTPCELVIQGQLCHHRDDVARLFPKDRGLQAWGARGYVGVPLRDADGVVIGHLVLVDDKPIDDAAWMQSLLHALAARAAAELERGQADRLRREAVAQLEAAKKQVEAENTYLRHEVAVQGGFHEIIGSSVPIRRMLEVIGQAAPTDTTVLIVGETGTGKELVARAIHGASKRANKTLVSINCGAISPNLVESELFGHERGAFTGATARRAGRFELADGGTLFLDEIGDLSMELQVKLLRVLQEGEITTVGGSKAKKVDVRIIAATHRDLSAAVREQTFRQDLYYRLNVFPIRTPPLRDRLDDLPLLVEHMVRVYGARIGKRIVDVPASVYEALRSHQWPGNVRELANVIERSVIISSGPTLQLAEWMTGQHQPVVVASGTSSQSLESMERNHILKTLKKVGWKVSGTGGAAEALGLKPTTLEARMKKLGIKRPGK